jgi:RNA methyltransferase, TrmH family
MVPELSKNEIKHINALKSKKYRYAFREFIVEGPKAVREFLQEGWKPVLVVIENSADIDLPVLNNDILRHASPAVMARVSALQTPNTVIGMFSFPPDEQLAEDLPGWTIALDDIRDPGNLGTIIRIADWFGISRIVCSLNCADPFNPKTVQATMGSLARIKVWEADLNDFFHKHADIPVFGAVMDGTPYHELSFPKNGILLVGNESNGISPALLASVKHLITIPRIGKAESLNAAVATAIICSGIRFSRS